MAKNLEISMLLDFYGEMLTEKQQEVVSLYHNEDLSLAEIAQIAQITRQGVRDSIKRGEATLLEMEERLGLARKFREMETELTKIIACAREIVFEAEEMPRSRPIIEQAKEIERIADKLMD
ncbi:MAG: YlxM family DNA-binding protein [Oscillospiraceae bacterium]|nr:YlxM family DNA-binding protein [Oscillospiraceae bacterium]